MFGPATTSILDSINAHVGHLNRLQLRYSLRAMGDQTLRMVFERKENEYQLMYHALDKPEYRDLLELVFVELLQRYGDSWRVFNDKLIIALTRHVAHELNAYGCRTGDQYLNEGEFFPSITVTINCLTGETVLSQTRIAL